MRNRPEWFSPQTEYFKDNVPCEIHGNRHITICVPPGEKAKSKI
jgi:hypothetical protein